jgi:predicted glycosyltransferase
MANTTKPIAAEAALSQGAPARTLKTSASASRLPAQRIWIDLDNTPHVPFFRPIIRELEARDHEVIVTARDAFQVCELADLYGMNYTKVGRHYGKNPIRKVLGLVWRSLMLLPLVLRHRPTLALSHGARSQILVCNLLRIPTVMVMDYEHAKTPSLLRPRWEIVPQAISKERLHCATPERIMTYEGIKEDVYAPEFKPDPTLPGRLGLRSDRIVVTVRPPASEAHYHSDASDALFVAFMEIALARPDVQVVLLPRNKRQEQKLRIAHPHWFSGDRLVVPEFAVDGLNLLWNSDLVVSGGGTMNREAAALGLPVYSIFRGPTGSVDRQLEREGRLTMLKSVDEVALIALHRRERTASAETAHARPALATIVEHVVSIARIEQAGTGRATS